MWAWTVQEKRNKENELNFRVSTIYNAFQNIVVRTANKPRLNTLSWNTLEIQKNCSKFESLILSFALRTTKTTPFELYWNTFRTLHSRIGSFEPTWTRSNAHTIRPTVEPVWNANWTTHLLWVLWVLFPALKKSS